MPTAKKSAGKKTASKTQSKTRLEQRVTTTKSLKPKKTTKKIEEANLSEFKDEAAPKSRIVSRKYLYAVVTVLIIVGILFAASRFLVVAWVDNKPITRWELYSLLDKRDEGKTTEELIQEKLLESEGQKQRQSVSEAEIEAEMKKVEEAQGGAAQLDQILALNRLSRDDFKKLVRLNLLKQKLFGQDVNISEEDVNKYIEENKDSLPPGILDNPESSEAARLRESVKEQLRQTKINENFNTWLEETMNSSRVSRNVPSPTQPGMQITPQ